MEINTQILQGLVMQQIGGVPYLFIIGALLLAFGLWELALKNPIQVILILIGIVLIITSKFKIG